MDYNKLTKDATANAYLYPDMKGVSPLSIKTIKCNTNKYREGFENGMNHMYEIMKADTFRFMEWANERGYDFVWSAEITNPRHMLWFSNLKKYKDDPYITTTELYFKFRVATEGDLSAKYFTAAQVRVMMRQAYLDRIECVNAGIVSANFDRYCKIKYPDI